jgi:hypothetical protein
MPARFRHFVLIIRRFPSPQLLFFCMLMMFGRHVNGQSAFQPSYTYMRLNEVNGRAARHFLNHYAQATVVKWSRDDDYLIASFKTGKATARSYYKINGNFAFCIKNYSGEELNSDLKLGILQHYPGGEIILVTELTMQDKQAYYIKIKCNGYIKTLCCNDDGIVVTENFVDAGA